MEFTLENGISVKMEFFTINISIYINIIKNTTSHPKKAY